MSQSIRTLGASALGAVIVAVAALTVHVGPTTAAPATVADPATHTISVAAGGKVTVVPDVARLSVGVTVTRPSVKAARSGAAGVITNIVAAIKGLGVAEADIQTSGLSLYPQYARGSSTRITGYTIGQQLQITVRDLDKAGDVVDAATAKGATEVNGISFELADPAKAMNDARASAIAAAQVSAQAMAAAGHVTLGSVVSITDVTPYTPIYTGALRSLAAAAPDMVTPIQAGTQDVSVTVNVVFEIA
jgi:uncharacterized protein YggE